MTIASNFGVGLLSLSAGLSALHLSPWVGKRAAIARLRHSCRCQRSLSLTYDDGPGRLLTPKLLDLLAAHDARATFFLLGKRILGAEDVVDRIASSRHELGCHSMDHLNAWTVSPGRALADVRAGYQCLGRWMGAHALFRPPYGKLVFSVWWHLRRTRAPLGWWTEDSGDTFNTLPPLGANLERIRKNQGGVVLLHDFDRDDGGREDFVLKTTDLLLQLARRERITVKPLGEILRSS